MGSIILRLILWFAGKMLEQAVDDGIAIFRDKKTGKHTVIPIPPGSGWNPPQSGREWDPTIDGGA